MSRMDRILGKYMLLVEKISNTTKTSKTFGTDVNIYRSEIHIIQLVGDRREVYISEIARLIGVTKGTVSQIVKRLENKGLAKKMVDGKNNTRQLVSLTEKGMVAYRFHIDYHNRNYQEMENFLSSLSAKDRAILEIFLQKADEMISDHP